MKRKLIFWVILFASYSQINSQIIRGGLNSEKTEEYIFNDKKNKYIKISDEEKQSKFVLSEKLIYFNKHNKGWLGNEWFIHNNKKKAKREIYKDMLGQEIILDAKKMEIWYYWGEKKGKGKLSNLSIYKDLKSNPNAIEELNTYFNNLNSIPEELNKAYSNQDWRKSIEISSKLIANNNSNPNLYYIIGSSFYFIHDTRNASKYLEFFVSKMNEGQIEYSTYAMLGDCYQSVDEHDLAIKYLSKAIEKGEITGYLKRGVSYNKATYFDNAIKDFETADRLGYLKERPEYFLFYADSYFKIGNHHFHKQKNTSNSITESSIYYRKAIEILERYNKIVPNDFSYHKLAGKCYVGLQNFEEAMRQYTSSLKLNSNQSDVSEELEQLTIYYNFNFKEDYVQLKEKGSVYQIPATLNNSVIVDFIFDSGAGEVLISPEVAYLLISNKSITEKDVLEDGYFQIADGSILRLKRFVLEEVQIGKRKIYNVKCAVSNEFGGDMLLGQSVLKQLGKYTFDYNSNRLIIK